jgi:hypothetical protein
VDSPFSGADPLERLAALRAQFYSGTQSLGGRPLLTGGQAGYPENRRWRAGPVTFTTVHVVGSNDNFGRTPEADAEHTARKVANLAWIAGAFAEAVALGDQAVVLIMQANLRFERSPEERTGFNDYLGLLEERTAAFTGKVFLVHGDTHRHRIDQPMRSSETGERLSNFTRVETFGHPDVEWVRASVDPSSSDPIEFEPGSVRENG